MKSIYKIAFTGKMGAGKSTAAMQMMGLLAEKYTPQNSQSYLIQFANPLHNSAKAFHRREKPRTFLQRLGDLARREFGEDIFEKIFEENVEGLVKMADSLEMEHFLVVTDDLRFLGENRLLKALGFTTIKIEADEEVRKRRLGPAFTNVKHRSEIEMEQIVPDFVVDNSQEDPHFVYLDSQLRQLCSEYRLLGG